MHGIPIRETIRPSSACQFRSHGCIRVQAEIREKFFEEVELHAPGEVIYIPVKAAVSEKGRVFREVYRDYYALKKNFDEEARKQLEKTGVTHNSDWQNVQNVHADEALEITYFSEGSYDMMHWKRSTICSAATIQMRCIPSIPTSSTSSAVYRTDWAGTGKLRLFQHTGRRNAMTS